MFSFFTVRPKTEVFFQIILRMEVCLWVFMEASLQKMEGAHTLFCGFGRSRKTFDRRSQVVKHQRADECQPKQKKNKMNTLWGSLLFTDFSCHEIAVVGVCVCFQRCASQAMGAWLKCYGVPLCFPCKLRR